jgi:hypothetical protein
MMRNALLISEIQAGWCAGEAVGSLWTIALDHSNLGHLEELSRTVSS